MLHWIKIKINNRVTYAVPLHTYFKHPNGSFRIQLANEYFEIKKIQAGVPRGIVLGFVLFLFISLFSHYRRHHPGKICRCYSDNIRG